MRKKLSDRAIPSNIHNESNEYWKASDEAMLRGAINNQLSALSQKIANAKNPNQKNRLKAEKKRILILRDKVNSGNYGGTELFRKLDEANIKVVNNNSRASVSRYDTMDFKFEDYFRQTRYYGAILPFLIIVFIALFVGVLVMGAFLPKSISSTFSDDLGMPIDAVYTFKLSAKEDFLILNNGKWPNGTWDEATTAEQGKIFITPTGNTPDTVRVYSDLKMTSIKLSVFDVVNAFFRTNFMAKYRISFIEDIPVFEGADWFYAKYLLNKDEFLSFGKQADGTYNTDALIYIIAVYGTIFSIVGMFILAIFGIVSCIISLFTYTGRRLHLYALFMLIFTILALFLPAFLAIPSNLTPAESISSYFTITDGAFLESDIAQIKFNLPLILTLVPAVFVLILPKLFKNRPSKLPTYVPKGNKAPSQELLLRIQEERRAKEMAQQSQNRNRYNGYANGGNMPPPNNAFVAPVGIKMPPPAVVAHIGNKMPPPNNALVAPVGNKMPPNKIKRRA